jgi:hypothetical protein
MKRIAKIVLLIMVLVGSPQAARSADPNCSGDGCDSLSFYWEAPCHKIKNIGSRPVKWTWGAFSGRLKPTEIATMMNPFGGGCVSNMLGVRAAVLD